MKKIDRKYLGQTTYNREGYEMTIIEAKNTHDITVLFPEVGIVKKKKYYRDFLQGSISIMKDLIPDRVGQCKRMKNGKFCTIIEYENSGNCKVRFENGYVKRTSYTHFVNGEIGCCDKKRNLLNKTYVTKNSKEKYVITKEYDDTDEVEVKFLSNGKTFAPMSINSTN